MNSSFCSEGFHFFFFYSRVLWCEKQQQQSVKGGFLGWPRAYLKSKIIRNTSEVAELSSSSLLPSCCLLQQIGAKEGLFHRQSWVKVHHQRAAHCTFLIVFLANEKKNFSLAAINDKWPPPPPTLLSKLVFKLHLAVCVIIASFWALRKGEKPNMKTKEKEKCLCYMEYDIGCAPVVIAAPRSWGLYNGVSPLPSSTPSNFCSLWD